MPDDSLKREIETERRAANKNRRLAILVGVNLLLAFAFGAWQWTQKHVPNAQQNVAVSSHEKMYAREQAPASNPPAATPTETPVTTPTVESEQTNTPQTPPSGIIDKNTFVANADKTLTAYGTIIGLVTFGPSDSVITKASRISQAVALDKQAFSQVTNLRAQLVQAGVTDGTYMELTKLTEGGASSVSVGLTFMNYWANNPARMKDLNMGTGIVTEGAELFVQLSDGLNKL